MAYVPVVDSVAKMRQPQPLDSSAGGGAAAGAPPLDADVDPVADEPTLPPLPPPPSDVHELQGGFVPRSFVHA